MRDSLRLRIILATFLCSLSAAGPVPALAVAMLNVADGRWPVPLEPLARFGRGLRSPSSTSSMSSSEAETEGQRLFRELDGAGDCEASERKSEVAEDEERMGEGRRERKRGRKTRR